ncbi:hypothetical protein [Dermatobacter hominis]|uniref:hypothetical protein n=1 Tax=Dermatobacter hominis TaxID=2884263 RepID=UPI001D1267C1|nr:hypothetical protein [Dermatobacter hominis]UDY36275.1 hypothetical protein LH044_01780 [Dermatobacter hominis]
MSALATIHDTGEHVAGVLPEVNSFHIEVRRNQRRRDGRIRWIEERAEVIGWAVTDLGCVYPLALFTEADDNGDYARLVRGQWEPAS